MPTDPEANGATIAELTTERLTLRPLTIDDRAWVDELYGDQSVTSGFGQDAFSPSQLEDKMKQLLGPWARDGFSQFLVIDKGSGEVTGLGGIRPTDTPHVGEGRLNSSLLSVIDAIFRVCVKLVGLGFVLFGLVLLFGAAVTRIYMSLHNGRLFQENLFPVGAREQLLVWIAMGLACLISIFLIVAGIAIFKRKWPLNSWVTGVLAAIFLAGAIVTMALTADAVPRVNERYQALMHTTAVKNIQPFDKVVTSGDIDISYISSPDYAANIHYADHPDLSKIKIYVTNGTLYIDSRQLDSVNHCTMLCLYPRYDMTVQIYAPNVQSFDTPRHTDIFYPKPIPPTPIAP